MNDPSFPQGHNPYSNPNGAPRDGIVRAAPGGYAYPPNGAMPYTPVPYGAPYAMPAPYAASYGQGATGGSGGQMVHKFMQMLWRRRYILAATLCSVLFLTWFFTRARPVTFVSKATLQVIPDSRANAAGTSGEIQTLDEHAKNPQAAKVETQLVILRSAEVFDAARAKLAQTSPLLVRQVLGVEFEGQAGASDLIDVKVQALSPQAAQEMANVVCEVYIARSRNTARRQLNEATEVARQQMLKVGSQVERARDELSRFQRQTGFVTGEAQMLELVGRRTATEEQLQTTLRELRALEAQLADARAQAARTPVEQPESRTQVPNAEAAALQQKITELQLKRFELQEEYVEGSPQLEEIDSQIAQLRTKLRQTPRTELGPQTFAPNPVRKALDQQISSLQSQILALRVRSTSLRQQLGNLSGRVGRVPELSRRLAELQARVATLSDSYQQFNDRYNQYRTQAEIKQPDAQQLFAAQSSVPVAQNRKRNVLIGAFLGLLLAIALAALVDWLDDRMHSEEDAKSTLQLPVLAQVPMAHGRSPALTQAAALPSPMLENFRMLRTLVAFSPFETPARSVLMTSSLPGEGKSVCAANLAIAAALSGERVILIDGDLRRPTQHDIFEQPNDIGFSNVASGHCSLRDALKETRIPGLRVLTGGPVEANPFTLLNGPRGREVLREAQEMADLVVIDSPPALLFADAQLLASEADAVLLVVSARDAGRREVSRTRALLQQIGTKPVGIVLNKLGGEADSYDKYASKYGSYYGMPRRGKSGRYAHSNGHSGVNGASDGTIARTPFDESVHSASR